MLKYHTPPFLVLLQLDGLYAANKAAPLPFCTARLAMSHYAAPRVNFVDELGEDTPGDGTAQHRAGRIMWWNDRGLGGGCLPSRFSCRSVRPSCIARRIDPALSVQCVRQPSFCCASLQNTASWADARAGGFC
jgi:hypothetical protein